MYKLRCDGNQVRNTDRPAALRGSEASQLGRSPCFRSLPSAAQRYNNQICDSAANKGATRNPSTDKIANPERRPRPRWSERKKEWPIGLPTIAESDDDTCTPTSDSGSAKSEVDFDAWAKSGPGGHTSFSKNEKFARESSWSVGSVLHESGKCRPCSWYHKAQGCINGEDCMHCHLCPSGEVRIRQKMKLAAARRTALQSKTAERPKVQQALPQGDVQIPNQPHHTRGLVVGAIRVDGESMGDLAQRTQHVPHCFSPPRNSIGQHQNRIDQEQRQRWGRTLAVPSKRTVGRSVRYNTDSHNRRSLAESPAHPQSGQPPIEVY